MSEKDDSPDLAVIQRKAEEILELGAEAAAALVESGMNGAASGSLSRHAEAGNRFRIALNLIRQTPADSLRDGNVPREESLGTGARLAERESTSLAGDLHDGPVQRFAAAGLMVDLAREYLARGDLAKAGAELSKARSVLNEGLGEMRSFLFQLAPSGLKEGFHEALSRLARDMKSFASADVSFSVESSASRIPLQLRTAVFRVVSQAAANAVRHGGAGKVDIRLAVEGDALMGEVRDDGAGFDVKAGRRSAEKRGALGLASMEDRIRLLGGEFCIWSEPGKGTVVRFSVPLPEHEEP
mgnify:CR=1 FL=1